MAKGKSYMCPLVERELQDYECYDIQLVHYGYDKVDTLDFAFNKEKADIVCDTCRFNQYFNGFLNMRISPTIIILFIFLALPIPILLMPLAIAIKEISDIGIGYGWSNIGLWIRSLFSLDTYIPTAAYLITYLYSLIKTIRNKKISRISYLPLLHIGLLFGIYVLTILMLT